MKFKLRKTLEIMLDAVPDILEIAITSINPKPGELTELIDKKLKKWSQKAKTNNTQKSNQKRQRDIYKEIGKEQENNIELLQYYNDRSSEKHQKTKDKFIQRLHDLEKLKNLHRELDLER